MTSSTPPGMPAAEVAIGIELVRSLLRAQHADLADLPLSMLAEGWDTMTFRLGAHLVVRLPRRAVVGALITNEHDWLPRLAPLLPLPIPVPLRVGAPQHDYPWAWSILPYLPGEPVGEEPLDASVGVTLGGFLRALHSAPLEGAPVNPFRGGPLVERNDAYLDRAKSLDAMGLLPGAISRVWSNALDAAIDVAPTWLHGDLHPLNVLMHAGQLSAVLDWIDVCAGDPATDLASVWLLPLTADARAAALAEYGGISRDTLARAQGWAAYFGVVLLSSGLANAPRHARIGERVLRALAEEVVV